MRKIIGVALLVATLTGSAYAGDMQNGITGGTPPGAPTSTPTSSDTTNEVNSNSSSQPVTTSTVQIVESALGVVQSVLSLI